MTKLKDMSRFERQIQFFGQQGQEILGKTRISIAGVGGLGSHIAQQMAFLGVGHIIVIDNDVLDISNLNRLIGSRFNDRIGIPKVDIAGRTISEIDPKIEVLKIKDNVISKDGLEALKNSNFIFGCVDNDGTRLFLNELSLAYEIPYIDLASEIVQEDSEYGGRVVSVINGPGCLYCLGEISSAEAGQYLANPNTKMDLKKIYGIDKSVVQGGGPSVVTINGIIASLAATEFLLHRTGIRQANKRISYYGSRGVVSRSTDEASENCYYCNSVRGTRDKADLERYIIGVN